jgi:hypothetical protein
MQANDLHDKSDSAMPRELAAVQSPFRSPRVRHLLGVLARQHPTFCTSTRTIMDVSQSVHMTGFRTDGICTTITCGAVLYVPGLRRTLRVRELAALMGLHRHESELESAANAAQIKRMIGNTMHVAVVGTICVAALSAAQLDSVAGSLLAPPCHSDSDAALPTDCL